MYRHTIIAAVATFLVQIAAAEANGEQSISDAEYAQDWPFTFSSGTLRCQKKKFGRTVRPLVTIIAGSTEYGVNGAAMGVGGYPPIRPMLKTDQHGFYTVGKLSRVIDAGLALCDWS